jgi:NADH:ubiquinone oxidoreductase subunit 5 (subunit L)/multisubunit Na+/H+ antiporter MnhA subunit
MRKTYLLVSMAMTGLVNFALLKAFELFLVMQIVEGSLNSNDLWFLQGMKISFPIWFQVFFVTIGLILGIPVGQRWWYAVCVEKKTWRFGLNWSSLIK